MTNSSTKPIFHIHRIYDLLSVMLRLRVMYKLIILLIICIPQKYFDLCNISWIEILYDSCCDIPILTHFPSWFER